MHSILEQWKICVFSFLSLLFSYCFQGHGLMEQKIRWSVTDGTGVYSVMMESTNFTWRMMAFLCRDYCHRSINLQDTWIFNIGVFCSCLWMFNSINTAVVCRKWKDCDIAESFLNQSPFRISAHIFFETT
jgi:hypothetical protein